MLWGDSVFDWECHTHEFSSVEYTDFSFCLIPVRPICFQKSPTLFDEEKMKPAKTGTEGQYQKSKQKKAYFYRAWLLKFFWHCISWCLWERFVNLVVSDIKGILSNRGIMSRFSWEKRSIRGNHYLSIYHISAKLRTRLCLLELPHIRTIYVRKPGITFHFWTELPAHQQIVFNAKWFLELGDMSFPAQLYTAGFRRRGTQMVGELASFSEMKTFDTSTTVSFSAQPERLPVLHQHLL